MGYAVLAVVSVAASLALLLWPLHQRYVTGSALEPHYKPYSLSITLLSNQPTITTAELRRLGVPVPDPEAAVRRRRLAAAATVAIAVAAASAAVALRQEDRCVAG